MKRNLFMPVAVLVGSGAAFLAFGGATQATNNSTHEALAEILVPSGSICTGRAAKNFAVDDPYDKLAEMKMADASNAASNATAEAEADALPMLWEGLGPTHMAITTSSDQAQAYFDQGVRLTFNFNHHEAIRAFKAAQKLDPTCAMCFWGEGFALGPNINAPMDETANEPALAATAQAVALKDGAKEWEQALIEALATRYSTENDRAALDQAFAAAMVQVADRFPDDHDIAALTVEAQMDTTPWDYWEADKRTPKGAMVEGMARVKALLEQVPDHPAGIHLLIHITEAGADPKFAEPYADKLGALAPNAGHLVHMPSHTYYRLGRFKDSITVNIAAVEIDEAYIADTGAQSLYTFAYYPHNVHFVMAAALMAGNGPVAIEYGKKLLGLIPADVAAVTPLVQPILAAPLYALGEFAPIDEVKALPNPAPEVPYVTASWHYAQGLGAVRAGDMEAAETHIAGIALTAGSADFSAAEAQGIPASDVMKMLQKVLRARMAAASGDLSAAEAAYKDAATLQDGLNYTEPPYWYYPVRRSLGGILLRQGKAVEAEAMFRRSLSDQPNDGWALYGLMQAYDALADGDAKAATQLLFERAWDGEPLAVDQL